MQQATLLCIATAVALAGASTTADAARTMGKENQAAVDRIKASNARQPRTMAEAERTQVSSSTKGVNMMVATELQATLMVQKDAQGNMKVVEVEGNDVAAPAAEVVADE